MPPGQFNPDNAGIFEAIKMPEKTKGPEKKGPDMAKVAELKAAADARKAREAGLKAAEAPQIDSARKIAQELAVSGGVFDAEQNAVHISAANVQKIREAADRMNRGKMQQEDTSDHARIFTKAETQAIRDAAQGIVRSPDGHIMKEVSPLSVQDDAVKIDRQPAAQPTKKKGFFSRLFD